MSKTRDSKKKNDDFEIEDTTETRQVQKQPQV